MYSSSGYEEYCAGYNIVASDGTEVVGCEGIIDADPDNAAFIVKAVNSHEALVEALRVIAAPLSCGCKPCVGQCRSQDALEIVNDEMRGIARAALSAIEKGEEA
jgi:hypothetical protein